MPMNLFSDRRRIEQEYLEWIKQNPEVKDCPFTVISFLEGAGYLRDSRAVGKPESNRSFINSLPNKEFAERTISYREEPDYDYDIDDEIYQCGTIDIFTTSDGCEFGDMENAIEHELWWLDQPYEEAKNG